jgi:diketogulonate reductase-like aldo/keto reductase
MQPIEAQVVEANGARIPLIGLGTFELSGDNCARLVEQAIVLGYRHIDTAQMYGNEREVGDGVRASKRRGEVTVVTKVQPSNLAPSALERSVKESLARLRLDAIDILLIHWPNKAVPLAETIGAMCKMKQEGYTRHIGVSNFNAALLAEANALTSEPLVCNQFEAHPFLDVSRTVRATRSYGMAVTAYSPIARGDAAGDTVLTRIGASHGKTAAQVSLRWLVQQQIAVIPRTRKVERLAENVAIFDFHLTDTEMAEITALTKVNRRIVDWQYSPKWD